MGFSVKKGKLMKNLVILLFFCNFIVIYSFIIVWRYASWPQSNNSFKARCNSLWILFFSNKAKKMRLVVEYLRDNHDSVFKDYTCILLFRSVSSSAPMLRPEGWTSRAYLTWSTSRCLTRNPTMSTGLAGWAEPRGWDWQSHSSPMSERKCGKENLYLYHTACWARIY